MKTVIFIDDDDSYLIVIQRACKKHSNINCITFQSPNQALSKIIEMINNGFIPFSIYADFHMNELNGVELFNNIFNFCEKNKLEILNKIQFVILTSCSKNQFKNKFNENIILIEKPSSLSSLSILIEENYSIHSKNNT